MQEDILDVARIENGTLILNKEKFNLNEMITEILREYEQKMIHNKKNLKLSCESHNNDEIIIVEGDRNRLFQVVSNLLNNAIKFTNEGSITIIVERKKDNNDNDEIVVSIKDTGTGIDSTDIAKTFYKICYQVYNRKRNGIGVIYFQEYNRKTWRKNMGY